MSRDQRCSHPNPWATAALSLVLLSSPGASQPAQRIETIRERARVALVIGNDNYATGRLANAVNDAKAMGAVLERLAFKVEVVANADGRKMERAIESFVRVLGKDDVGLFYYAGHGAQIEGENFLIPVGFDAQDEVDVRYNAYAVQRVHDKMEAAGAQLSILILDACRDNPFRYRSTRRSIPARGLAPIGIRPLGTSRGTLIAFATAPGQTASDDSVGNNGLFTHYLIGALLEPGLELEQVFLRVRVAVAAASQRRQVPWISSGVLGDFYFLPPRVLPPAPFQSAPALRPPKPPTIETFDATPVSIYRGQSTTLAWSVINATHVSINQSIGTVQEMGSRSVSPSETSDYVLTATGSGGTARAKLIVFVSVPAPPGRPSVERFLSAPSAIERGDSATLRWQVRGANVVGIDQGIGLVEAQGERRVSPTTTTMFTLTASGPGGSVSETATVAVSKTVIEQLEGELEDIQFDLGGAALNDDARESLTRNADILKAIVSIDPSLKITIEGHGDVTGSSDVNLLVCGQRATTVRDFLIQLGGLSGDQLEVQSYGKDRPLCTDPTEECNRRNRRVHFVVMRSP